MASDINFFGGKSSTPHPHSQTLNDSKKLLVVEDKSGDSEFKHIEEQFLDDFMEHVHDYVMDCVRIAVEPLTHEEKLEIAQAIQHVIDQKMGDISTARNKLNWRRVRLDTTLNASASDLFSQVVIEFSKRIHKLFAHYFTFEDDYSMADKKGISDAVHKALEDFHEDVLYDVVHDIDLLFREREKEVSKVAREPEPEVAPEPAPITHHHMQKTAPKEASVYVPTHAHKTSSTDHIDIPKPQPIEIMPPAEKVVSSEFDHEVTKEEEKEADKDYEMIVEHPPALEPETIEIEPAQETPAIEEVLPAKPETPVEEKPRISRYIADSEIRPLPVVSKESLSSQPQTPPQPKTSSEIQTPSRPQTVAEFKARGQSMREQAEEKIEQIEALFVSDDFAHNIQLSQAFNKSKLYELELYNKKTHLFEVGRSTPADVVRSLARLIDKIKKLGNFMMANLENSQELYDECAPELSRLLSARKIDER